MFSKSPTTWGGLDLNPGLPAPSLSTLHLFPWDVLGSLSQAWCQLPFLLLVIVHHNTLRSHHSSPAQLSYTAELLRKPTTPHTSEPLNSLLSLGRGGVKPTWWHLLKVFFDQRQQTLSFLPAFVFSSSSLPVQLLSAAEAWLPSFSAQQQKNSRSGFGLACLVSHTPFHLRLQRHF